MIISIEKQLLENSLFFISKSLGKSKTLAQYNGIQFFIKNKKLFMYSSNGTLFCEVTSIDVDAEDSSWVVDFSLLDKVVSLSDEKIINLDFKDDALYIAEKKSEYKMQYMVAQNYNPYFTNFDPKVKPICKLKISAILSVFSFLDACIPNQSQFAQLRGVYCDGHFVSTNSHALAICNMIDKDLGTDSFFLSLESFTLLSSLTSDEDTVSIYKFGNGLMAVVDNTKYILSTMVNAFPDYKKVLTRLDDHIYSVTFLKNKLIKSCKRLASFTDVYRRHAAKFTFSTSEISVDVMAEAKKGKESVPISSTNIQEEYSFSINLPAFLEYISHTYNAELKITFGESLTEYAIRDGEAIYMESTLE